MIEIMLLSAPDPSSSSFKILLIASEIIIPLIIGIGMYFIFKPVFGKGKNDDDKILPED